ncbi:MAG: DUF433 domain-containing protein [bacterium]
MTINQFIESDPRRCNGKPTVAGTRIPVMADDDQILAMAIGTSS